MNPINIDDINKERNQMEKSKLLEIMGENDKTKQRKLQHDYHKWVRDGRPIIIKKGINNG